MTTGERMKKLRTELNIPVQTIADALNVSIATVYRYENGDIEKLPSSILRTLSAVLRTTPEYLMGWSEESSGVAPASNMVPLETMDRIPMVGTIACGVPILAEQNIEDYVDLPKHIKADFALTCQGDSMIEAGIRNGDIVYIRQQSAVDNGQIAAVLVDGSEATLKRFYLDSSSRTVTLMAANQAYAPIVRTGEDVGQVKVLGLAVAYTHPLV